MTFICKFCNLNYTRKDNLTRHLKDNRCTVAKKMSVLDFHNKLEELEKAIIITGNNNQTAINSHNTNNINVNVAIQIQPITKLSLDHITPDKMKEVIESYDGDPSKFSYLFTNYLNNVLCNSQHPENHSIKYVKKYPPTFNTTLEDSDGNIITVIKGLKDTCELLGDPVLDVLKVKLRECVKKYKKEDDPEYDYDLYEDTIKELRKELKKDNIKKVLGNFLKNDLINNIEMKLSVI
jgi:hypothetical protein